jgi:hypothetical protein
MMRRRRERVPPFVHLAGNVYVVTKWDDEKEDVVNKKELILRQLAKLDREIYAALMRDAEMEAHARVGGSAPPYGRRRK